MALDATAVAPPPEGGATTTEPGGEGRATPQMRYPTAATATTESKMAAAATPTVPSRRTDRPRPQSGLSHPPRPASWGKLTNGKAKSTRGWAGPRANWSGGGGRARKTSGWLLDPASRSSEGCNRVTSVKNNFTEKLRLVLDSSVWQLCRRFVL